MQVLGGHQHDHRHPERPEFGGVGPHRGESEAALAQGAVSRMHLQQPDRGASGGDQFAALARGLLDAEVAGDRIGGPGEGPQFVHRGGGGHRQQEATPRPQGRQPIGGRQQEGHTHLELGPL